MFQLEGSFIIFYIFLGRYGFLVSDVWNCKYTTLNIPKISIGRKVMNVMKRQPT